MMDLVILMTNFRRAVVLKVVSRHVLLVKRIFKGSV